MGMLVHVMDVLLRIVDRVVPLTLMFLSIRDIIHPTIIPTFYKSIIIPQVIMTLSGKTANIAKVYQIIMWLSG